MLEPKGQCAQTDGSNVPKFKGQRLKIDCKSSEVEGQRAKAKGSMIESTKVEGS